MDSTRVDVALADATGRMPRPRQKKNLHEAAHDRPMETLYQASHNAKELIRATRKQAKPSMRRFAKCLAIPEDECAVLQNRRQAQEADWSRILRDQRAVPSAKSRSSVARSDVSSNTFASMPSDVTAGLRTQEVLERVEDNRCATFGRMCMAMSQGDALPRGPPLPLPEASARLAAAALPTLSDDEYQASAPDRFERLGRLVQVGTRP
eukprot:TRINITY_DN69774_c0_g1_i1.p1 TRINITY_DN69774_c0_g1~~TRINITY_DN69774_c0_g1_i1.p1  ORF type:complete len:208 (-),score=38.20 TRINITY_DN69774_c0_g1_i1:65-688(-)